MDRPDFTASYETQQIVKILSDESHAADFTYAELAKVSGITDHRHLLRAIRSAGRIVSREKKIAIVTVPTQGVKRANDCEIVQTAAKDVSRIRRTSRRAVERLSNVRNFAGLPRDKQTEFNTATSSLMLIQHVTTQSAQRKIESQVEKKSCQLPVGDTIAALGITRTDSP